MTSDLTAIRIGEDHYRLFVGTTSIRRDLAWLRRHVKEYRVSLHDSTDEFAVLGLMGPDAGAIIEKVGATELNSLKYFQSGASQIAGAHVRAVRLSYVGEAGWEITCKGQNAERVYDALYQHGARPAGIFAQSSMRIEKRFLAFGHDLDTDISPVQSGLDFAVAWDTDFIGKGALEKQREAGEGNRIVTIIFDEPGAVPLGNEPVYFNGQIIGKTTSASFGYRIGKPVAIADINLAEARVEGTEVQIDIARNYHTGRISLKPAFDPEGSRMRLK